MDSKKDLSKHLGGHFVGFKRMWEKKSAAAPDAAKPTDSSSIMAEAPVHPRADMPVEEAPLSKKLMIDAGESSAKITALTEEVMIENLKGVDTSIPSASVAEEVLFLVAQGPVISEVATPLTSVAKEPFEVVIEPPSFDLYFGSLSSGERPCEETLGKTTEEWSRGDVIASGIGLTETTKTLVGTGKVFGGSNLDLSFLEEAAVSDSNAAVSNKDAAGSSKIAAVSKFGASGSDLGALGSNLLEDGADQVPFNEGPRSPSSAAYT